MRGCVARSEEALGLQESDVQSLLLAMSAFCAPHLHLAVLAVLVFRKMSFFGEGTLCGPHRGACARVGGWGGFLARGLTVGLGGWTPRRTISPMRCLNDRSRVKAPPRAKLQRLEPCWFQGCRALANAGKAHGMCPFVLVPSECAFVLVRSCEAPCAEATQEPGEPTDFAEPSQPQRSNSFECAILAGRRCDMSKHCITRLASEAGSGGVDAKHSQCMRLNHVAFVLQSIRPLVPGPLPPFTACGDMLKFYSIWSLTCSACAQE